MDIGKLYSCKDYYLLLYPDKVAAVSAAAVGARASADRAAYWSRKLSKPVSYCDASAPLLVLNTDNEYVEVLVGDKRGWIVNVGFLKLKEIG